MQITSEAGVNWSTEDTDIEELPVPMLTGLEVGPADFW